MKKLFLIMVLVMGVIALNAQRTPVKVADLPKGVSDSINKEYPGYTIKETTKVVQNNVTSYEVEISKGSAEKTLTFDNSGKSLKSKGSDMDMDRSKSKSAPESPSTSPKSPSSTPSSTPSSSPSSPTTTPPNK